MKSILMVWCFLCLSCFGQSEKGTSKLVESLFGEGGGNRFFYYPTKKSPHGPEKYGLKHEEVTFKSGDGTLLHGWFIHARGVKKAKGTVVFSHGNAGAVGHHLGFIVWAVRAGYNALLYDYRGYGKSKGTVERKGIVEDVRAAFAYVKTRKDVDPKRLISFGHSLGGAKSIAALGTKPIEGVRGIISFAGFSSYRKMARKVGGAIGARVVTDELSPRDYIEKLAPVPLLIVHGTNDRVVPYEQGEELFKKAKEPKSFVEVKGGSHNGALWAHERKAIKKMLSWMEVVLQPVKEKKVKEPVAKEKKVVKGHVFAWPFVDAAEMQPRGGMTRGAEVVLNHKEAASWVALQEKGLKKRERDRRAILAMAGDYRVSFDFVETMGFKKDYQPPKPYFSWGTERVKVLKNEPRFISLQHTLVMYFKDKEGKSAGHMIMKHWRQDWRFEDADLHEYVGRQTWKRRKHSDVLGTWSQAVYQVDDSPRYEVIGRWSHEGGMSTWKSENAWRPLPRREFSMRDDYNVLAGVHELTITRNGWVHVQNNQKVNLSQNGEKEYVGQELGVSRYERITSPSLAVADQEWDQVKDYWAEVRAQWQQVYQSRDQFTLKSKVEDKKLWQHHFAYATQIKKEGYDPAAGRKHARETIDRFLSDQKKAQPENY